MSTTTHSSVSSSLFPSSSSSSQPWLSETFSLSQSAPEWRTVAAVLEGYVREYVSEHAEDPFAREAMFAVTGDGFRRKYFSEMEQETWRLCEPNMIPAIRRAMVGEFERLMRRYVEERLMEDRARAARPESSSSSSSSSSFSGSKLAGAEDDDEDGVVILTDTKDTAPTVQHSLDVLGGAVAVHFQRSLDRQLFVELETYRLHGSRAGLPPPSGAETIGMALGELFLPAQQDNGRHHHHHHQQEQQQHQEGGRLSSQDVQRRELYRSLRGRSWPASVRRYMWGARLHSNGAAARQHGLGR